MPNARIDIPRHCPNCSAEFFPFRWEKKPNLFCSRRCKSLYAATDRFWACVQKADDCWLWAGNCSDKGYGRFKFAGKMIYAHRFALELAIGRTLSAGEQGNHGCDNPPCVRVAEGHVFLGSQKDNIQDAMQKGHMSIQRPGFVSRRNTARGERSGMAKLTDQLVRSIRELRSKGWSQQRIADHLGIKQPNVSRVIQGLTWRHVG